LTAEGDRLRYSVPRARRPEVEPALATLQAQKADALRLLCGQTEPESLETVLKGLAIELWTNGESFWLVADETDAARLSEPRGRVFTAAEARLMVRIADPAIVAEVREWKRRFDGARGMTPTQRQQRDYDRANLAAATLITQDPERYAGIQLEWACLYLRRPGADEDHCRAEIAVIEALLRSGHPDIQGLCLALVDWNNELRLIQRQEQGMSGSLLVIEF